MTTGTAGAARGRLDALFLNLPSPPRRNVLRNYAGAFGISLPSPRTEVGHDGTTQPCTKLVYAYSAARRAGLRVAHVDAQAERLNADRLRQRALALRPDVIVSVVSLPTLEHDLELLAGIKAAIGAKIVVAGTVCRANETLEVVLSSDTTNAAVTGDPEIVAVPLIEELLSGRVPDLPGVAWVDTAGARHLNGGGEIDALEDLPIPVFDELPMDRYVSWEFGRARRLMGKQYGPLARVFPLFISRGCPYACPYCPYPLGLGRRWLHKPAEQFVEEVRGVVRTGTRNVLLQDQTVSEDVENLSAVCEALIREDLRINWLCEARVGSLTPDMLKLMRRAGCVRIHYGAETGDPDLFKAEAKRFRTSPIDECLRQTKGAGILPSLHFLVGFSGDSWSSIAATLDLIGRCNVSDGDCSIMTPYPGTKAHEEIKAAGRLLARGWADYSGTDAIITSEHMSPVELAMARWRILEALSENRRRSARRRLREAAAALRSRRAADPVASAVDAASDRVRVLASQTGEGGTR